MNLRHKIPSIYHHILPEILDIEFPEEQIATCDNCTLCRSTQSPYINTKCCAYHPHLANFLIGGLLSDNDKSLELGQKRIQSQIKQRSGITPYGIIPSVQYSNRKKEKDRMDFSSLSREFKESQLCPYYEKGNCTVWKYRENLCVTHFCSSIGGNTGKAFWKKVNHYLKMVETNLSQFAMLQLGWPPSKIRTEAVSSADFNLEDKNGIVNNDIYRELWGEWLGKEEKFYKACFEIIQNMDVSTLKRITGMKRELLDASIRDTGKKFQQNILSEIIILHSNVVISANSSEGITRLNLEEISAEIPTVILPLIRSFNGTRKTVEVFHLGYNILFNMSEVVNELCEKGILIKCIK